MTAREDTEELLRRAGQGDARARGAVLQRHRPRLRRMVAVRLDRRLAARLDPSDVVQEALAEADRRLDDYLSERPLPFYPWLRQIAWERLVQQHRRHLHAGRRSVRREEGPAGGLPDESVLELAGRLLAEGASPSEAAGRSELRRQGVAHPAALAEADREVLALRYLEGLSAREVGAVLGLGEQAAKKRALRALQRLRESLDRGKGEGQP